MFRKLLQRDLEMFVTDIVSRVLWPPYSASVVVVEDAQVLVVEMDGMTSLPGGVVERGESSRDAAVREVREETGIEIGNLVRIDEVRQQRAGPVAFFRADVKGGELDSSIEGSAAWMPLENLEQKNWRFIEDTPEIVQRALDIHGPGEA